MRRSIRKTPGFGHQLTPSEIIVALGVIQAALLSLRLKQGSSGGSVTFPVLLEKVLRVSSPAGTTLKAFLVLVSEKKFPADAPGRDNVSCDARACTGCSTSNIDFFCKLRTLPNAMLCIKGNSKALATVSAIIDGMGSIGAALGPMLTGYITSRGGFDMVFMMLYLSAGTAGLMLSKIAAREFLSTRPRR
ncbi:hypothetical protein DUNSADRAFT_11448 [Dunaliella salina]|uniref:Major facilitator superfamily (MFS) profile domain-containing protein n=1 Tax=Dunaliella salina TaxID=3046 RepID=A0ABQ7GDC9_DUNSA|nr:hypothetical protein DUNSADRAFT_11448 [Dunaliella salina]|eukprot:KAF5832606.1 hypothetical protein DUNSADRAFT_11448 [Dunaliella salina]